jgi:hypothetical protein
MFHLASVRKGTLWDSGKKERVEPWDDVSHMRWDGPGPRGRQKIEELSGEKKKKKKSWLESGYLSNLLKKLLFKKKNILPQKICVVIVHRGRRDAGPRGAAAHCAAANVPLLAGRW